MDDKPIFDFTRFSWRDAKSISRLQARATRVSALLDSTETMLNRDAFDEAMAAQDEVFDELQAYIARVLVSVPASWLVPDAPDDLEWSDPDSLDWLRGNAFSELRAMMIEASRPESVTGN